MTLGDGFAGTCTRKNIVDDAPVAALADAVTMVDVAVVPSTYQHDVLPLVSLEPVLHVVPLSLNFCERSPVVDAVTVYPNCDG